MNQKRLLIVLNNNMGEGLSGGDTICINMIKCWHKIFKITIMGSSEAKTMLERSSTPPLDFIIIDKVFPLPETTSVLFVQAQIRRTFKAIQCFFKHYQSISTADYVYTASDFYPDLVIGFLFKLFHRQTKWIAGFYLKAPNPFKSSSPYNQNHRFYRGLIYYLGQLPGFFIIKLFADLVFVTSEPDVKLFLNRHRTQNNVFIVQGGVDNSNFSTYKKSSEYIPDTIRKYDAVYLGRLHPQKGVLELIDIWRIVVKSIPKAKLIMIGNGDLAGDIRTLINKYQLSNNIELAGFLIGEAKLDIFKNSRIVVHPSIYDSGGMSAAEAMAWGLPGVCFDLPALQTYYPYGMIKSEVNNLQNFAANIVKLLLDNNAYQKTSEQALVLISKQWNWQNRFQTISKKILT